MHNFYVPQESCCACVFFTWPVSASPMPCQRCVACHVSGRLQSMTGARQMITVIITFRKSHKNSPQHQASTYQSSRKPKHPTQTTWEQWEIKTALNEFTTKQVKIWIALRDLEKPQNLRTTNLPGQHMKWWPTEHESGGPIITWIIHQFHSDIHNNLAFFGFLTLSNIQRLKTQNKANYQQHFGDKLHLCLQVQWWERKYLLSCG
jgi:hypothetical protein